LAGGLLAGCGGGGESHTQASHGVGRTTRRAATGTPSAPQHITVSRARELARQVNLLAADVPGYTASSGGEREHETGAEKRWERELLSCASARRFPKHGLVEASSPKFERERGIESSSVQSNVTLAQSAILAREELEALKSRRGATCLTRFLGRLLESKTPPGATVGRVHVAQGAPPARGTTGSFGLRISSALNVNHVRVPVYFDFLGFADGPVEVLLQTTGVPSPFPTALEERLYLLLLDRTKAHAP